MSHRILMGGWTFCRNFSAAYPKLWHSPATTIEALCGSVDPLYNCCPSVELSLSFDVNTREPPKKSGDSRQSWFGSFLHVLSSRLLVLHVYLRLLAYLLWSLTVLLGVTWGVDHLIFMFPLSKASLHPNELNTLYTSKHINPFDDVANQPSKSYMAHARFYFRYRAS